MAGVTRDQTRDRHTLQPAAAADADAADAATAVPATTADEAAVADAVADATDKKIIA